MPIKTEVEQIEKNLVLLKVEVPFDELGTAMEKAYRDITKKIKIPGFRQGKAPRTVVDQMVGKEAVKQEALNELIPKFYPQAIDVAGIEPVAMPQIEVVQFDDNEPFIFKARVEVKPEVKLGSYAKLDIDDVKLKPVDAEIKTQLEQLQNKFATLEVVKGRPAKKGDFLLIDYDGYIKGKSFEGGRGSDYMLELGSEMFISGFEDQLLGAKAKDDVEVKISFPAEYEAKHLAGEEAVFKVAVKEIKAKKQPKADDDFAKNVSKFETIKELKADLKQSIQKRQASERDARIKSLALDKMVELSQVDLPGGMVLRRVDRMIENFGSQIEQVQGATLQDWLKSKDIDLAEFKDGYREDAERNIKTELVLEAVFKDRDLNATDEEVESEIEHLAERAKKGIDEFKKEMADYDGYDGLKRRLSMSKAVDFLASKAKVKKKDDEDESSTDSD